LNPFSGGDKSLGSFKDWCNAIMQRCQEIGGGQFWYSPVSNLSMILLYGTFVTITANFVQTFVSASVVKVKWSGLMVACDNADQSGSGGSTQLTIFPITDNTTGVNLVAGQCIYVDVDRSLTSTAGLTAVVGTLDNLGLPPPPKTRFVIVWAAPVGSQVNAFARDNSLPIGVAFPHATTTTYGSVELDSDTGFTSWGGNTAIVVNGNGSGLAIAEGISRGDGINPPYFTSGVLSIGTQAQDANLEFGSSAANFTHFTQSSSGVFTVSSLAGTTITLGSTGVGNVGLGTTNMWASLYKIGASPMTGGTIDIGNNTATTTLVGSTISLTGAPSPTITVGRNATSGSTTVQGATVDIEGDTSITVGTTAATSITIGTTGMGCDTTIQGQVFLGDGSRDSTYVQLQNNGLQIGAGTGAGFSSHLIDNDPAVTSASTSFNITSGGSFTQTISCTDVSGLATISTVVATSIANTASTALLNITYKNSYSNTPVVVWSFGYSGNDATLSWPAGLSPVLISNANTGFSVGLHNPTGSSINTLEGNYTVSYIVMGR
jgi:hypothetical protein